MAAWPTNDRGGCGRGSPGRVGALRELTWGRRKTVEECVASTEETGYTLRRELNALDVTVLGVGVIIGAGIFVLTGNAAATEAGPARVVSVFVTSTRVVSPAG